MVRLCSLPFVFAVLASAARFASGADAAGPSMWFGKIDGAPGSIRWNVYSADPAQPAKDVWRPDGETLICAGAPSGYLRTDRLFADFTLQLEWRRSSEKPQGRGGILLRTTGPDQLWPKSLEAQLNGGSVGDFWGLGGYVLDGPRDRLQEMDNPKLGRLINLRSTSSEERPAGDWNEYEIVADGSTVVIKINGKEVNKATGCDATPGALCLTAEGDEIHFRRLLLKLEDDRP